VSPSIGDRRDSAGRWGAAWRDRVCPTAAATGGTGRVEIVAACIGRRWRLVACGRRSFTSRSRCLRRSRRALPTHPGRDSRPRLGASPAHEINKGAARAGQDDPSPCKRLRGRATGGSVALKAELRDERQSWLETRRRGASRDRRFARRFPGGRHRPALASRGPSAERSHYKQDRGAVPVGPLLPRRRRLPGWPAFTGHRSDARRSGPLVAGVDPA
jgi:hypothetical protein